MSLKADKKVNEECNVGVGFDDTLKVGNYILSIVSIGNGIIYWIFWNIISREANVIVKIYESLIKTLYWILQLDQSFSVGTWKMEYDIEINKTNKKKKVYSYMDRLEKLGLMNLLKRRMRDDLIETSKIINGFFLLWWAVFKNSSNLKITGKASFKIKVYEPTGFFWFFNF